MDATRGVNLKPQDSEEAIRQMVAAGAKMVTLADMAVVRRTSQGQAKNRRPGR